MLGLALNPIHSALNWGNGALEMRVTNGLSSGKGDTMTGSLRRRITGILALAIGLGVVLTSAPATAAPVHTASTSAASVTSVNSPGRVISAADWWW